MRTILAVSALTCGAVIYVAFFSWWTTQDNADVFVKFWPTFKVMMSAVAGIAVSAAFIWTGIWQLMNRSKQG